MGYKVMLNHWVIKDDMMSSKKGTHRYSRKRVVILLWFTQGKKYFLLIVM